MMENNLSQSEKRKYKKAEWNQKYGRFWIVYTALLGTGLLSAFSGLALPFQPDEAGLITFTAGRIAAAFFYAVGFISNGEFAAWFWFDKLTDHDKDNGPQQVIGVLMLIVSVFTILITSIAAGTFIAYYLGVLDAFSMLPYWAQQWVVWSIPVLWVIHFVAGVAFKTISDEAGAERDARTIIRETQQEIAKTKAQARADYWKANAPAYAVKLGTQEAKDELQTMYGSNLQGEEAMAIETQQQNLNDAAEDSDSKNG